MDIMFSTDSLKKIQQLDIRDQKNILGILNKENIEKKVNRYSSQENKVLSLIEGEFNILGVLKKQQYLITTILGKDKTKYEDCQILDIDDFVEEDSEDIGEVKINI
jgi:hypothetical protein